MFDTHCRECQRRQLIFPSQVVRLVNDEHGIVAIFTCWCGAPGAERLRATTGRKSKTSRGFALAS